MLDDTCACCTTRVCVVRHVCMLHDTWSMLYDTCARSTTRLHVIRHVEYVARVDTCAFLSNTCHVLDGNLSSSISHVHVARCLIGVRCKARAQSNARARALESHQHTRAHTRAHTRTHAHTLTHARTHPHAHAHARAAGRGRATGTGGSRSPTSARRSRSSRPWS